MASPAAIAAAIKRDREKSLIFMASIVSSLDDNDSRLSKVETMLAAICEKLEIEIEQPVELTDEQKKAAFADIHAAAEKWTGDNNAPDELSLAVADPVVVETDEPNPFDESVIGQG